MAALVVTTPRQRYVIPFETVQAADAASGMAVDQLANQKYVEITNGFMTVFVLGEIETIQIIDHVKPQWLLDQQATESQEMMKVQQRAQMGVAKSTVFT